MKTIYTIALAALVFLILGLDSAGAQQMKENTVKEQIVGTWRVLLVVNVMDGSKAELFGPTPKWQFMFTSEGHFSINIIRPDRPKFTSNNRTIGTAEENKEALVGNISTFGDYTISSDGSINLEIVGSSFPNWDDSKQKHLVEIKGDEMTWTDPTASTGETAMITLQRAKSGERYPQRDEK
jgi:Lipocalin-like domain